MKRIVSTLNFETPYGLIITVFSSLVCSNLLSLLIVGVCCAQYHQHGRLTTHDLLQDPSLLTTSYKIYPQEP